MPNRALSQSYLTMYVSNRAVALVATEAIIHRTPITMSGKIGAQDETVTGLVQSVEEDINAVPARWRITILEDNRPPSQPLVSLLRP
jgi:hypothetical protein